MKYAGFPALSLEIWRSRSGVRPRLWVFSKHGDDSWQKLLSLSPERTLTLLLFGKEATRRVPQLIPPHPVLYTPSCPREGHKHPADETWDEAAALINGWETDGASPHHHLCYKQWYHWTKLCFWASGNRQCKTDPWEKGLSQRDCHRSPGSLPGDHLPIAVVSWGPQSTGTARGGGRGRKFGHLKWLAAWKQGYQTGVQKGDLGRGLWWGARSEGGAARP